MNRHQPYDLKQMQSVPLEGKILMTKERIRQWYEYWKEAVNHNKDDCCNLRK